MEINIKNWKNGVRGGEGAGWSGEVCVFLGGGGIGDIGNNINNKK